MNDNIEIEVEDSPPSRVHYDKAAKLLKEVTNFNADHASNKIAAAQVHALLALRDMMLETL